MSFIIRRIPEVVAVIIVRIGARLNYLLAESGLEIDGHNLRHRGDIR